MRLADCRLWFAWHGCSIFASSGLEGFLSMCFLDLVLKITCQTTRTLGEEFPSFKTSEIARRPTWHFEKKHGQWPVGLTSTPGILLYKKKHPSSLIYVRLHGAKNDRKANPRAPRLHCVTFIGLVVSKWGTTHLAALDMTGAKTQAQADMCGFSWSFWTWLKTWMFNQLRLSGIKKERCKIRFWH